jgi:hypothetical protein
MRSVILGFFAICSLALGSPLLRGDETAGFRFQGGNVSQGKITFERMSCTRCHLVKGVDLALPEEKRLLTLTLGEKIRFAKRYEDIVTAISNPQHVVTKQYSAMLSNAEANGEIAAFMPNLTNEMTVRQLMDLAAFLDKAYTSDLKGYTSTKKTSR